MALNDLIVVSGVPRSGKTRVAQYLAREFGFIHVCSDDIREEYGMDWGTQDSREAAVNHVVRYRALEALMMERDVIIDTTAMFRDQRRLFFDLDVYALGKLYSLNARKSIVSLDISRAIWEQRQQAAGRSIEHAAFYFGKFEPVSPEELPDPESHLRFQNETEADFGRIKDALARRFRRQPDAGHAGG